MLTLRRLADIGSELIEIIFWSRCSLSLKFKNTNFHKIDFTVEKMHFYKITDLNYESHPIKMFAISVR